MLRRLLRVSVGIVVLVVLLLLNEKVLAGVTSMPASCIHAW